MNIKRLDNSSGEYFQQAWKLYSDAFPIEERRSIDDQTLIMNRPNYHFNILIEKNKMIGFILWWEFDTFRYIDHFATSLDQRNKGIGKLILENFIKKNDKPILLEVELPNSSINQRRIKFYERIGFKLNLHYYDVPSSNIVKQTIQLLVMTYPDFVSQKEVEQFTKNCHPILFNN